MKMKILSMETRYR